RALPLLRAGKSLRFLALPPGEDPDSLIRTRGAEAIRRILDLARPLADIVWDTETEGRVLDTPEPRASLQHATDQRAADIADPGGRDYSRSDMRSRLARLRRVDTPSWQPRRRSFRDAAPDPAPFAAGAAARRAADPEGSHQARALLGALIERPALLHILAEELAALPIPHPELARLPSGLLDALSLGPAGLDPAVEEAFGREGPPLEACLIEEHLQRAGLGRLAAAAQAKARAVFRDEPSGGDGWVEQWRRMAHHLGRLAADLEE